MFKLGLFGLFALIGIIMLFSSWVDVNPGEEGFMYKPYGGGVDTSYTYKEGTFFVAPWNDVVTYNILQESKNYNSTVMDLNGTDITVNVSINFAVKKGNSAKLHLKHGVGYLQFIDDKVKGSIKDVVGRYTYKEVYSSKRESLEDEIEYILRKDFAGNYLILHYVEIADVNLPANIATEITVKETQKQKNMTSELKKVEEKNLADAKVERAKGDSAKLMINSQAEAEAIRVKQQQLSKSPQYIEYMKADKWNGSYGEGNVFGGEGVSLFKSIR